jgi:hypothetical protein
VSGPGPPPALLILGLVLLAAALLPAGELLRRFGARYSSLFRGSDPIERGLLDFYLAGAALYAVGSIPLGFYTAVTPAVLIVAGGLGLGASSFLRSRAESIGADTAVDWRRLTSLPVLVLLVAVTGLFVVEVAAATSAATGNTFDSSMLATFVGLLSLHHDLPLSYAPVAALAIPYPQATTAWLGAAQFLLGLPPARTPLLATPLFFALAPLGAYAWGRRWMGMEAGVALGLFFALVASWPRLYVAGSNDFVLAFPLLMLLWALWPRWSDPHPPTSADLVAFGVLTGYCAALNPVGIQLTFLSLPFFLMLERTSVRFRLGSRLLGGIVAGAVALLALIPSLVELWIGRSSPGLVAGGVAPVGTVPTGLSGAQIAGLVDPFLLGSENILLSPFLILRVELIFLLLAGAVLILTPLLRVPEGERRLGRFALAFLAAVGVLFAIDSAPVVSGLHFYDLHAITNVVEVSMLLFSVFGAIACLPLVHVLRAATNGLRCGRPSRTPSWSEGRNGYQLLRRPRKWANREGLALAAVAVAGLLLVPGTVVTVTSVPSYLAGIYSDFGNVSDSDFALLTWAEGSLPAGAVVLVAPGSAAGFLPAYSPTVRLEFPMGLLQNDPPYRSVIDHLVNGSLTSGDRANLTLLGVEFLAVTGNDSRLYPAINPAPLLSDPQEFVVKFHEGDAWLFETRLAPAVTPALAGAGSS